MRRLYRALATVTLSVTIIGLATDPGYAAMKQTSYQQKMVKKTPKFIYNITVKDIYDSTVTINFFTKKDVTTTIYYGTDPSNLNQSHEYYEETSTHWNTLKYLAPDTTYYFKIVVTEKDRNILNSSIYNFTTASARATISGVKAYSTSDVFSKFEWVTDKPANSVLYYGTSPVDMVNKATNVQTGSATLHWAYAENLKPDTTYFYMVTTEDGLTRSDVYTFTTSPSIQPVAINGIKAYSTTDTFTKFEWYTNPSVDCLLYYGPSSDELIYKAINANSFSNGLYLAYADSLQPNTTYYYQVVRLDGSGKSEISTFTTLPATK